MEILSRSSQETVDLGERLGRLLVPGDIVLLFGDLGAGKTTLTQGLARGLGLPPNQHTRSPSFTLINEYRGRCPIYHIDLYRLDSFADVEALGLEDVLFGEGVSIVEWSEKLFPSPSHSTRNELGIAERLEIRIRFVEEDHRQIEWKAIKIPGRNFIISPLQ
ncbi:MAG: tRNA (adenosine(37)-N6)-threonylcarbamoyltransferase complex ATPase subunit type 1 TsaE [Nitrospinae bacterium CG11_big_fil_rev_8_21_14_0_20_56_8]|nr:MAG: tRNA (adenosine(37)-N6)-threonylcarbamoyltransferase complex ATPase subunit type 1 TsaE [Nitrospinae bacterium CG11_big_fil_rev_8_21_14_0_20_56_8]